MSSMSTELRAQITIEVEQGVNYELELVYGSLKFRRWKLLISFSWRTKTREETKYKIRTEKYAIFAGRNSGLDDFGY